MTTAPSWMSAEQAAAFERGVTAADAAGAGVAHHEPAQPAFDPDYRPQVRPTAPSAPYSRSKVVVDPNGWWHHLHGLTCTCPPGCTERRWGDAGTCARSYEPCRLMAGHPYVAKPKSPKRTNTTSTMDDAA